MRWWVWLEVGSEDTPWWQRLIIGLVALALVVGVAVLVAAA